MVRYKHEFSGSVPSTVICVLLFAFNHHCLVRNTSQSDPKLGAGILQQLARAGAHAITGLIKSMQSNTTGGWEMMRLVTILGIDDKQECITRLCD